MQALELLSGDARTFKESVWASHVHVHRAQPDALVGLLSFDDVDRLLTSTAIRTPAVRLAKDGAVLPAGRYTRKATLAGEPLTGLLDARKVIDLFEDGATVVLQGLQRYWPPLTELVGELELALGHPCQANAYLTPPGSQGFDVHSDSHDVFVFQTHGAKLWEVHPAPGEVGTVTEGVTEAVTEAGQGSAPREVLLEPGVSMYLPTGTPHAARARETVSLHVTIGINQLTWRSVLERVVRDALGGEELHAEDHLPAGYLEDPEALRAGLTERLRSLADILATASPDDQVARQQADFLSTRPATLRGGLVERMALPELSAHTRLRRRPGTPCVLQHEGDRLRLLLGDRDLVVPARILSAVERILDARTLTPATAGLDPQSNLVLCRRLVREGLLEAVR